MRERRIITLTTDFGTRDGYVGIMKGVILGINPQATIVDITHAIAPQRVEEGAFLFATSARYFPTDTIHVVVVDPGVGSARRPIAMQSGQTFFVAPDNGVLTHAIVNRQALTNDSQTRAVHLNRAQYWLPNVSNTFHGRDIFAPVAAHLSLGIPLEALGDPIRDWMRLEADLPARRADGALIARVRHIDHFGNLVINVVGPRLNEMDRTRITINVGGRVLRGIQQSYADVEPGEVIALFGSSGNLEISVRNGSAADVLKARVGDEVVLT